MENIDLLQNLKEAFKLLIHNFPSLPRTAKPEEMISAHRKHASDVMNFIQQKPIPSIPKLNDDDHALLSSESDLLASVFYQLFKLMSPPYVPNKYLSVHGFFSLLSPELLEDLIQSVSKRNSQEARFIENILLTISFDNPKLLAENSEVLMCLQLYAEDIKLLEHFEDVNNITKKAYSFIRTLFEDKEAQLLLARAYGLLNIPEKNFPPESLNIPQGPQRSDSDPEIEDPKRVVEDLQDLLPKSVVQFGTNQILMGKTFSKDQIAISKKCFIDSSDGLNDIQRTALLVVTLLHEMAHLKKINVFAEGKFKKPTPPKFCDESGKYVDQFLYGQKLAEYLPNLPEECANSILNVESWRQPGFIDVVLVKVRQELAKKGLYIEATGLGMYHHPTWNPEKKMKSCEEALTALMNLS